MNNIFEKDQFCVQIISAGSFLDTDPSFNGKIFLVETTTVRLNHIAMNEWIDVQIHNCRDCYDTDQEWQEYLSLKKNRENNFRAKIAAAIGLEAAVENISVTQAVSEVFTVVYIHEAK